MAQDDSGDGPDSLTMAQHRERVDAVEVRGEMRTVVTTVGLLCVWLLVDSAVVRADSTALIGVMTAGSPRPAASFAFGYCPSIVGFELEYTGTLGKASTNSSAAGIFINVIGQSTGPIRRAQFYGVGGFGVFGETGSGEILAHDIGGGAKIWLTDWLKLRLDYRIFLLGAAPDATPGTVIHQRPQRFSAGLTIGF